MLLTATIRNFCYTVDGSDSPFILLDDVKSKNPAPALLVKFMSNPPPEQPLFDYNRLSSGDEPTTDEPPRDEPLHSDEKSKPGIEIFSSNGKFELIAETDRGYTRECEGVVVKNNYAINSKRRKVDDFSITDEDDKG